MLVFAPDTSTKRGVLIGLEVPEGSTFAVDKSKKIYEQITEETWHQGGFHHYIGNNNKSGLICGLCLAGWILAVYGPDYQAKCDVIVSNIGTDAAMWNDDTNRKFGEVLQVLKDVDL